LSDCFSVMPSDTPPEMREDVMLILRGASGPIGLGGELHGDSFFIFCLASFHTLRGNHTKTLHDARQHPGNPSSRLIIKPAGQIDLGACAPACCAGLGLWQSSVSMRRARRLSASSGSTGECSFPRCLMAYRSSSVRWVACLNFTRRASPGCRGMGTLDRCG
jgi:hypothetical protein